MLAPSDPSHRQADTMPSPPVLSTVHFDDVQLIQFLWTSSNYLNHLESLRCSQKAGNVSLKSAESCFCLTLPGCQLRVHYRKLLTLGMVNHEDELRRAHPRGDASESVKCARCYHRKVKPRSSANVHLLHQQSYCSEEIQRGISWDKDPHFQLVRCSRSSLTRGSVQTWGSTG